jgi:hypothetical protein
LEQCFLGSLVIFWQAFGKYEIRHQTMMFIGTTSQMSKSGDKHANLLGRCRLYCVYNVPV